MVTYKKVLKVEGEKEQRYNIAFTRTVEDKMMTTIAEIDTKIASLKNKVTEWEKHKTKLLAL